MKITKEKTNFGTIVYYVGKYFRFAMYIYDDDSESIYLSNVYVDPLARGNNLGNEILKLAEQEALKCSRNSIFLTVLRNSWMHDWYSRNGFSDYAENDEDSNYIWMLKNIGNSLDN